MTKITSVLTFLNLLLLIGYISYKEISPNKVAFVDANYLLNNYKGMQSARKEFEQKASGWQANIDTLSKELSRQIQKHQKDIGAMTAREKGLSEELIRTKQKQLEEYRMAMTNQAQQEDEQMTQKVLSEVNAYIKQYGEKKGYTIILAATDYGNIAYADEGLNITEEILVGLNK